MIVTEQMIKADPCDLKDLWGTPDHIYNPLDKMFGFTHDPCCLPETSKCKNFWTPKENGLLQDWSNACLFVNPPYSRGNIDKWVEMCSKDWSNSVVVALLPVSTSADWFQKYVIGNTLYWVNKRIRFVGAPHTAPFSSVIVHFNGRDKNLRWNQ